MPAKSCTAGSSGKIRLRSAGNYWTLSGKGNQGDLSGRLLNMRQRNRLNMMILGALLGFAAFAVSACGTSGSTSAQPSVNLTPSTSPLSTTIDAPTDPSPALKPTDLVASAVTGFGEHGEVGISIYVFANGRVLATDTDAPWRFSEFTIKPALVDDLRTLGAQRNLLALRNAGQPGITDQDSLVIQLRGPNELITQRVYAPGETAGLTTDEVSTRNDVDAFADALRKLPDLPADELLDPMHTYIPQQLVVNAYPVLPTDPNAEVTSPPSTIDWGGSRPIDETFGTSDCITMTGADAEWIRTQAKGSSQPVFVESNLVGVPVIRFVAESTETYLYNCITDRGSPAVTKWPADTRTTASPPQRWAAERVLHQYAYAEKLGEYRSSARLTYLELGYAKVTVNGRQFVDLVGTDQDSSTGPFQVAIRVDLTTGKVAEFEVS